ncbi:MAG: hypothetical protein PWP45_91 [Tepidanaerobacteraceae bacterium]|nr:hypothetical protein [Tepidanaerobacteraceae bacterium]
MDLRKAIVSRLLDKYERSRRFSGDAKIEKRITLNFSKGEFPFYDIENVESKENVHFALKELEKEGIIKIKWVKFEEGNIVEKVFLNLENLEKAYGAAKREPKDAILKRMAEKLSSFKQEIKSEWLLGFANFEIERIREKKSYPAYLPKEEELFDLTLKALKGIEQKGDEEVLERVFSKRYLKDSKKFERVKGKVFAVIKDFLFKEDIEEDEAFEKIGILKTIEEILFCGALKATVAGSVVDFSAFAYGTSLNSLSVREMEILDISCSRVITVENKANYYELIKDANSKGDFIVYLGGFYSPSKRLFLEKLYCFIKAANKNVEFYHWGDIDLGGFKIFVKLKEIIRELNPLYMDVETLEKYKAFGEPFGRDYEERLRELLGKEEYGEFHGVIEKMLELKIRLEQEAIIA